MFTTSTLIGAASNGVTACAARCCRLQNLANVPSAPSATKTVATIRLIYGNWDDAKVVQPGEVLELRASSQGVEGRILPRRQGNLRLVLELDGEVVQRVDPHIGFGPIGSQKNRALRQRY